MRITWLLKELCLKDKSTAGSQPYSAVKLLVPLFTTTKIKQALTCIPLPYVLALLQGVGSVS